LPGAHWLSSVHEPGQAELVHTSAPQLSVAWAGHEAELPLQNAGKMAVLLDWQLALRHCCELGARLSLGQLVEVPLHVSAGSHTPALPRHTVPALPAGC
jgi:hypothetical protein